MYEVRETKDGQGSVVLTTSDLDEVLEHIKAEGFQLVMEIYGSYTFDHPDGRTALVRVVDNG